MRVDDVITVRNARVAQELYSVRVDTRLDKSVRGAALELPANIWFFYASSSAGIAHVTVHRDFDFGLGEGAQLAGVVDLNGDGTEELLTVWTYAGGMIIELLVRSGPTSFRRIAKIQQGT